MGRKGKEKQDSTTTVKERHADHNDGETARHETQVSHESPFKEESEHAAKFSKRKIVSNWEKYEENQDPVEVQKGLDFALFSDTKHHAAQEHFRFSGEKNWESRGKISDYFKLDLKDLSNEIMSVPLYERLRLDSSLFSEDQIATFIKDAKMFEPEYVIKSKEIETRVLSVLKPPKEQLEETLLEWPSTEEPTSGQSAWDDKSGNFFSLAEIDNALDDILSMPLPLHEAADGIPNLLAQILI